MKSITLPIASEEPETCLSEEMTAKSIRQAEDEIIEEFSVFDDWMSKYEYIIELGKDLPAIEPKYKTDEFKIRGCQSQVWLTGEYKDGRMYYKADSDALITKGIIALLIRVLSGRRPEEIVVSELDFVKEIGLTQHLSPNRANGLVSMINYLKNYAKIYAGQSVQ